MNDLPRAVRHEIELQRLKSEYDAKLNALIVNNSAYLKEMERRIIDGCIDYLSQRFETENKTIDDLRNDASTKLINLIRASEIIKQEVLNK